MPRSYQKLSLFPGRGGATVLQLASVSAAVGNGCDMSLAESSKDSESAARQKLDG